MSSAKLTVDFPPFTNIDRAFMNHSLPLDAVQKNYQSIC
jgi:hypothetical protein